MGIYPEKGVVLHPGKGVGMVIHLCKDMEIVGLTKCVNC